MKVKQKHQHRLEDAYHFESEDLGALAEGRLSERQSAALRHDLMVGTAIALLVGAVAFGLILVVVLVVRQGNQTSTVLNTLMLGVGLMGGWAIYQGSALRPLWRDLRDAEITQSSGTVQLLHDPRRRIIYQVTVDDQPFSVTKQQFLALKNGDPYTIYYSRRSRRIWGVDWLRDGSELDRAEPTDDLAAPQEHRAQD